MARLKRNPRGLSAGSARKTISSQVWIMRAGGGHGTPGFEACVKIGKFVTNAHQYGEKKLVAKGGFTCAQGKNPRAALAAALRFSARRFAKRKGAFAGAR